jgi:transcriptional regulator with XRE-family HTH domain
MISGRDDGHMARRQSPVGRGRELGSRLTADALREFRTARIDRGLSQREVGRAMGWSQAEVSRFERGLVRVTLVELATMLAIVGLEVHVRSYPAGRPLRDTAHVRLLGRLRARCDPRLTWRTEVPLPISRDQRAWDAVIGSWAGAPVSWTIPVEAETRPTDAQALERRLALKLRDSEMASMLLVLASTRSNREFVGALPGSFLDRFPVPPRDTLAALAAGRRPTGSSLILL